MKRYNTPIAITMEGRRPRSFEWNGRQMKVLEIQDFWTARSRWWTQEEKRLYMRVLTNRGTAELYHRDGRWWLAGVWD